MPKARISFVVPFDPSSVADRIAKDGWVLDPAPDARGILSFLTARVGAGVTATYDGTYPRSAVDALSDSLVFGDAEYVAVSAGGFDPAMDMPANAWIDVGTAWRVEGRPLRLPQGFRNPGIDVRTLVAAGMDEASAAACIAVVLNAAPGVGAIAGHGMRARA